MLVLGRKKTTTPLPPPEPLSKQTTSQSPRQSPCLRHRTWLLTVTTNLSTLYPDIYLRGYSLTPRAGSSADPLGCDATTTTTTTCYPLCHILRPPPRPPPPGRTPAEDRGRLGRGTGMGLGESRVLAGGERRRGMGDLGPLLILRC
jgi:hypothetical protein